jgi:hypothetical protein
MHHARRESGRRGNQLRCSSLKEEWLPWRETADAVSVVLWVKEQTDGAAQVQVEL